MKGYLSLNKMMSPIINILIERGVIKKSGIGINGNNYTKYSMVQPFSFTKMDKNDVTTIFLTTEDGAYVNKYINDNYIVKYSVNKANRELKTVEKEVVNIEKVGKNLEKNNMNIEIENLEKRVASLQERIDAMQQQMAEQEQQIKQLVNNRGNQPSTAIEEETPFFHDEEDINKVNLSELTDFFAAYNSDNDNDKG